MRYLTVIFLYRILFFGFVRVTQTYCVRVTKWGMMVFCEDDEMTTDTSSDSTVLDTQATPAPAKKAPGRPRKGSDVLNPAERQRAYQQRKQAAAQGVAGLVLAANHPLLDKAAAEAAQAELANLPSRVLLRALQDCLDDLEGGKAGPDLQDWRRSMARRIFVTLTQKYELNREDDKTVGED